MCNEEIDPPALRTQNMFSMSNTKSKQRLYSLKTPRGIFNHTFADEAVPKKRPTQKL